MALGTIHRLGRDDRSLMKVMVPTRAPSASEDTSFAFWTCTGLQYFTLWVDDIDSVFARCRSYPGCTVAGRPAEVRPGVKSMLICDPGGSVVEVMQEKQ